MSLRSRLKRCIPFISQDEDGWKFRSREAKRDPRYNDPNVYQPGEKMPPLKYRRPVAPEHKAHLESYRWETAWRRRSIVSQYSPMGTRLPSRRSSTSSVGPHSIAARNSIERVHSEEGKTSRGRSEVGVDSGFGGSISGCAICIDGVREDSGESSHIANGASRNPSRP